MLKKLWCWCFLLSAVSLAQAQQRELTGKVTDAKTGYALPLANVYVNNSTINASTNSDGEFVLPGIPVEPVEIICSFIGYKTFSVKLGEGPLKQIKIQLHPSAESLASVEIKASRDVVWEKQLHRFQKVFLGEGPNASSCKIKNPWVIDFKEEGDILKATASSPIEIENRALGYVLYFQLVEFQSSSVNYAISGNSRFEELPATQSKESTTWMKNREQSYLGSLRHLMKTIVDHTTIKEGFELFSERSSAIPRGTYFSAQLGRNVHALDTAGIVEKAGDALRDKIHLKDRIEVHYSLEFAGPTYYSDITCPVSFIEVKGGVVYVSKNGNILNPQNVSVSGAMSGTRMADVLPSNYVKGNLIPVQSKEVFSAKRLQEKTYLQTDKPYYYAGEMVWLSAFMNYRAPGLKDTLSKVLYVELISPGNKIVNSLILPVDSGRTSANFLLSGKLLPGNYMLRAYTNWMRNYGPSSFFYKVVPVLNEYSVVSSPPASLPPAKTEIAIAFDKLKYNAGDSIQLELSLPNANSQSMATLSLAVTDESLSVPIEGSASIEKDFIFSSEMPRDMLGKFRYQAEHGLRLDGTFLNQRGKPQKTNLTIIEGSAQKFYTVQTDTKGAFSLINLAFYDSMKYAIQSKEGKIEIAVREFPGLSPGLPHLTLPVTQTDVPRRIINKEIGNAIVLKTVEVVSKRQYLNPTRSADFYLSSSELEGYSNLALAIGTKITIFRMVNENNHFYLISNRGSRVIGAAEEAAVYVDNNLIVVSSGETVGDRINYMDMSNIDHIEASSMSSSQTGANGSIGTIYIYTKKPEARPSKGLSMFTIKGFDRASNFEEFLSKLPDSPEKNFPSTLYWAPLINLNAGKPSRKIIFKSSAQPGKYRVIAEGVTEKGTPFHSEAQIVVEP